MSAESHADELFINRLYLLSEIVGNPSALAKAAGLSQSGIRRYFAGGEPTRPVLIALANAAGVRVEWLAIGNGPLCESDTITVLRARDFLQKAFVLALNNPGYRGCGIPEAASRFCSDYKNRGASPTAAKSSDIPEWVRKIIPSFLPEELLDWRSGKLISQAGTQDEIAVNCLQMGRIAKTMRLASIQEEIGDLTLEQEAFIFRQVSERLRMAPDMPSDLLEALVRSAAFEVSDIRTRSEPGQGGSCR